MFVTHDQEEAMSISDMIVVMKDGILQQMGKPQDIYDKPVNLFVAGFLGTPQINVFNGKIKDGGVYIGDARILDAPGHPDMDIFAAIRPEGFVLDEKGELVCDFLSREVMGRDTSIIAGHEDFIGDHMRVIIPSEEKSDLADGKVRFSVKPFKVHIFSSETKERIEI